MKSGRAYAGRDFRICDAKSIAKCNAPYLFYPLSVKVLVILLQVFKCQTLLHQFQYLIDKERFVENKVHTFLL